MARDLFPHPDRIVFFDIETGGPLKKQSGAPFRASEFLRRSQDPGWVWTPEAAFHANNPILQLHATRIPHFAGSAANFPPHGKPPLNTYIKPPAEPWIWENGRRVSMRLSEWATIHKLAFADAPQTEEEALRAFFQGLEGRIALHESQGLGKVYLSGWNVGYDITGVERAARRYSSLERYHGFLGRMAEVGKLDLLEASDPMLETVLEYARHDEKFRERYLRLSSGKLAESVEDLRRLAGWNQANVAAATGAMEDLKLKASDLHAAFTDTWLTERAYRDWSGALEEIRDEAKFGAPDFTRIFHEHGLGRGEAAGEVLARIYRNPRLDRKIEEAARAGAGTGEAIVAALRPTEVNWRRFGAAAGVAAAAAVATSLAFSVRRSRQTQITGLADEGEAAKSRHRLTGFGSGWQGLDEQGPVDWRSAAYYASLYSGYRALGRWNPRALYEFARRTENFGPDFLKSLSRAVSQSHWAASWLPEDLHVKGSELLDAGGQWTPYGEHLNKLFGGDQAFRQALEERGEAHFYRASKASPWLRLEGTDLEARFVGVERDFHGSRWAGASARWQAEIGRPSSYVAPRARDWKQWFRNRRNTRKPFDPRYGTVVEELGIKFQPLFGRKQGDWLGNARQQAGILALEMMERPQRLLSKIGLGARNGTWNSALGLGGRLLGFGLGVAGAGLALDYADYLTGHRLSTSVAGVVPKARIAHAELTDKVPGLRKTTDWYEEHVPGPWYGPLMLPVIGKGVGMLAAKAATSGWITPGMAKDAAKSVSQRWGKVGLIAGAAAMLPFVPGMLGSRKTAAELRDIYSGKEPVEVRAGRWWELGNTPFSGRRITMYRPSWFARLKARPERVSLWGSEEEYWHHHPLLHPLRWLRNPYALEEHMGHDRPYPMASPALSNVPLIGPLLAATVGRLLKPPRRMHEDDWDGTEYTLFSPRVEPRGPAALPAPMPQEEFRSLGEVLRRQGEIAAEWVGLPGWAAKTLKNKILNRRGFGKEVFFEGSRQATSASRRYYDQELGAGLAPTPDFEETETYSEPLRRFVQRDLKTLQANEIPNNMPSWLPGEDYMTNFRTGDPYAKIKSGPSRLPGPGYAALHPELKDVAAEDYPLLERFKILSDVAPWSTQWFQHKAMLDGATRDDAEARIEYEKILARAEELKASSEEFGVRRYTAPVEEIAGTVKRVTQEGIELEEMPGRRFSLSALGMKASDLSAVVLGEKNELTRAQAAREVETRQSRLASFFSDRLAPGTSVRMVVPEGTSRHAEEARAVVFAGGRNINQELLDEGLALKRADRSGAEFQAMSGRAGKLVGKLAEAAAFEGDVSYLNPMHWVADPRHSKYWQQRTWLEQYKHHEVYGSRMPKWESPVHSVLSPWGRGLIYRLTGRATVPKDVEERRDLDTLTDYLEYLRSLQYTNNNRRTAVGANLFGEPAYLRSVLKGRDKYYFEAALGETDDHNRQEALDVLPEDFARILQAQWVKQDLEIARAEGKEVPHVEEGGRLKTPEEYAAYERAREEGETRLDYGNWERSKEIAQFFFRRNIRLPESSDSPVYDPNIDYEDVKAKIVTEEGYDLHDFNIFDDRAALLWRKPYLDGAVRELTTGNDRSVEQLRETVERMILAKGDSRAQVRAVGQAASKDRKNIRVTVEHRADKEILDDVRRHPDAYQDEAE
jgi:hypothetical protein